MPRSKPLQPGELAHAAVMAALCSAIAVTAVALPFGAGPAVLSTVPMALPRHVSGYSSEKAAARHVRLHRRRRWDPAAAHLGVHRHTLRNRIGKIAELSGRDLDSPGARAEFWFALQLLGQAANGPGDLPETRG